MADKTYVLLDDVIAHIASCKRSDMLPVECSAITLIKNISVADVVEVVRCCECIYHDDESQYHYCRKWKRNCPNDSDFFCKWGKRKYGGPDDGV